MNGISGLGRFQRGVLRMLDAAGTGGLASKDMAALATRTMTLGGQQSEVGRVLAGLWDLGLVARGEREAVHGGPYRWYITAEGTAAARRKTSREAAAASRARSEAHRQAAGRALEAARAVGFGPDTPRGEKRAVRVSLHAAGCTLQQIGDLFGVTRESVRRSLARAGAR